MTKSMSARAVGAIIALGAAALWAGAATAQNVTDYHNTPNRAGLYVTPSLNWSSVRKVHHDAAFNGAVEGNVYAQPLYWLPSGADVGYVIVATASDNVYALNANTGAVVWQKSVGTSVNLSSFPHTCGDIEPVGITGTPVIDPATATVFVDAMVDVGGAPHHQIFGLSLANGAIRAGWPIDVTTALQSKGTFPTSNQEQRSALAFANDTVYAAYAGYDGDCGNYHGWVVGVQTSPAPKFLAGWATRAAGGGSWGQSGIANDGSSLFFTTGNTFTEESSPYGDGEGVFRIMPNLAHSSAKANFFAPSNWQELDAGDADLGGTSAIPVDVPVSGGAPLARMLALGKDSEAYLLDRTSLGGIGGAIGVATVTSDQIRTAAATYPMPNAAYVAFEGKGANCPNGNDGNLNLTVLHIAGAKPLIRTAWCASFNGNGAPIATVTENATSPSVAQPIVWVVGGAGDGKLYGFRGTDGVPLFQSEFSMSGLHQWQTLIVAANRFYIAGDNAVYAFSF
jgi:hypothetical protein